MFRAIHGHSGGSAGPGAGSRRHFYHGGFGLSHLGPEVIMDLTDHSGRGVRASVIVVVGGGGREIALPAGVLAIHAEVR